MKRFTRLRNIVPRIIGGVSSTGFGCLRAVDTMEKKKKEKIKDRHDLRSFIRGTTLISPLFLSLLEISSMTISLSCQRIDRFDFSRVIFLEDELVRELAYFMEKVIIIGLLVPVSTKSCSGIIKLLSKVLHSLKNITSECWIRE